MPFRIESNRPIKNRPSHLLSLSTSFLFLIFLKEAKMRFSIVAILLAGHAVECVPGKKGKRARKGVSKGAKGDAGTPSITVPTPTSEPTSFADPRARSPPAAQPSDNDEAWSSSNGIYCAKCEAFEKNDPRGELFKREGVH